MYEIDQSSRREKIIAISIGIIFMIIALVVQEIVQSMPAIILIVKLGIKEGTNSLIKFEMTNAILYSLFVGGIAALFQEIFKYVSVDTRPEKLAIWIGLGFSVIDITILYVESVPELFRAFSILFLIEVVLNTISSLIFHPGTAMLIKYGQIVNKRAIYLIIAIFSHLALDAGVVYADIAILKNPHLEISISTMYWVIAIIISVSIFILGLSLMRNLERRQSISSKN